MKSSRKLDTQSTRNRRIVDFRKVGFKDVLVLGKYQYNAVQQPLQKHLLRDLMQICYCEKGQQVYEVDQQSYLIRGGEVFVTFPGEHHSTGPFPEEKGVMYWMIIRPGNKNADFLGASGKEANKWKDALLNLPHRHFKGSSEMKTLLENIFIQTSKKENPLRRIALTHLFGNYLLEVIRCSSGRNPAVQSQRWNKLQSFIDQNMEEPHTIAQLAKVTGLSPSHFKVWFKKETGTTPIDWVLRCKIKYAQQILRQNNYSIQEIAWETGFQTPQYFATVFKKYSGVRPTDYLNSVSSLQDPVNE